MEGIDNQFDETYILARMGGIEDQIGETCSVTRIGRLYFEQIRWENVVNIKIGFKRVQCKGVNWILLAYVRPMAGSCEHDNKLPSTTQCWSSLDQMGEHIISSNVVGYTVGVNYTAEPCRNISCSVLLWIRQTNEQRNVTRSM